MLYKCYSGKEFPKAFPNWPRVPGTEKVPRPGADPRTREDIGMSAEPTGVGVGVGGWSRTSSWSEMGLKVSSTESYVPNRAGAQLSTLKTSEWLNVMYIFSRLLNKSTIFNRLSAM